MISMNRRSRCTRNRNISKFAFLKEEIKTTTEAIETKKKYSNVENTNVKEIASRMSEIIDNEVNK